MKKIKRWIVRKLGGILYTDLPIDIQQILLNRAANKTLDFYAKSIFDNGFSSSKLPPIIK